MNRIKDFFLDYNKVSQRGMVGIDLTVMAELIFFMIVVFGLKAVKQDVTPQVLFAARIMIDLWGAWFLNRLVFTANGALVVMALLIIQDIIRLFL